MNESMRARLRDGTVGEYITWNRFIKEPWCKQIVDVRDDAFFREMDVDFLLEDKDRQFHWLEVKTDSMTARTGNIAYEKTSNKRIDSTGCFEKTRAEWIAYYVPDLQKIFLLSADALRGMANSGRFPLIDMGDNALGYLIPVETIKASKRVLLGEYDT